MSETIATHLPGDSRVRKLFANEWLEIVNLARLATPIAKIAETYGVDPSVIYRGLKKRKVRIGSALDEAAEEVRDKDRQEIIDKIRDTKQDDYKFTKFLQQQVIATIVQAQKANKPIGSAMDDVKTLKTAMDAIRAGTDNKWRILGLDKESPMEDMDLPDLPIREMTYLEVEGIRKQQAQEDAILDGTILSIDEEIEDLLDDVTEENLDGSFS